MLLGLLRRASFASALVFPLLAGHASAAGPGVPAVDRNTVVVGLSSDIGSVDPHIAITPDLSRAGWQLFDTLYGFDVDGNLQPRLATAYRTSADGLEYAFTLRAGVKFHNGDPFGAEDVKFSLERVLDEKTRSAWRATFVDLVDSVRVEAPDRVVLRLRHRDGAFINKLAGRLYIVPKKYTQSLAKLEDFALAPVGTGPYRLTARRVGQGLEFERFDGYWGARPAIGRLVFRLIPEPASRVNALTAGEVDVVEDVEPSDVRRLRALDTLEVIAAPAGSPYHVRLYSNVPGTPLAKREVRLALNHAIDKEALIRNVLHGVGAPLTSFISSAYPYGAVKGAPAYAYDPAKARRLLAQAGYPDGFETEVLAYPAYPRGLAEAVVAYWGAVGVKARIKVVAMTAFVRIDNVHQSGPMNFTQFANSIYDPIGPVGSGARKGGTWSDYENAEVEELLRQVDPETDRAKRDALFARIGQVLTDDGFDVLLSEQYYVVARKAALAWTPQRGGKYFNFRELAWR